MKKRDPSLTIRALITAAEALFTQKGYYPVTIKELGEKAGCSPALISYYFGGKKDLYRAVVDRQLSIIDDLKQETKETACRSSSFWENLYNLKKRADTVYNTIYGYVT